MDKDNLSLKSQIKSNIEINNFWKPEDVNFLFKSYQIYENKFLDILRLFPLAEENKKAWSPDLVNLFLDISSLVDSISRNIVGQGKDKEDRVKIKNKENKNIFKKVKNLNVNDFHTNLFLKLKLHKSKIVIYLYPLQVIRPFKGYKGKNGWWRIYNLLKHNRISNYKYATLENTLNSLAALFLLLMKYPQEEFSKALFRFDFLETGIAPEFIHSERERESWRFWYDSDLFGTHEIPERIPNDIVKINPALTSSKFRKFFGRFNP